MDCLLCSLPCDLATCHLMPPHACPYPSHHLTSCLPLPLTSSHLMLAPTPHIFFTEPHALIGSWKGAPHARQHPIL